MLIQNKTISLSSGNLSFKNTDNSQRSKSILLLADLQHSALHTSLFSLFNLLLLFFHIFQINCDKLKMYSEPTHARQTGNCAYADFKTENNKTKGETKAKITTKKTNLLLNYFFGSPPFDISFNSNRKLTFDHRIFLALL